MIKITSSLLALSLVGVYWWMQDPLVTLPGHGTGLAPHIVKEAHRYHGIRESQVDQFGYRFFYRDGKRCRLLNKNFLKHYKKPLDHSEKRSMVPNHGTERRPLPH